MKDIGTHFGEDAVAMSQRQAREISEAVPRRKEGYARGGKWIAGAIKHKGALHRSLGVPQGQKIPASKLAKAAHSSDPTLRRRANLAKTLKGFHH